MNEMCDSVTQSYIIKVFTYPRTKIAFSLSPKRQEAITPTNPVSPKYT